MRTGLHITLIFFGLTALTGCQSLGYYGQAIDGQVKLLRSRQPIDHLVIDPATPAKLKERLELIQTIRAFARDQLHLPVGGNYSSYVDLKRSHVVYNIFASPEFSLKPENWCYPVVGCVNYRGYFSEQSAREFGAQLRAQGLDVVVLGVTAYSTLGWFDDPILSSFVFRSKARLADLLFHELTHKMLYLRDDTAFNEGLAMAVAQDGLRRWAEATDDHQVIDDYQKSLVRRSAYMKIIERYRQKLEGLYRRELPAAGKRDEKEKTFGRLKEELRELKEQWTDPDPKDKEDNEPLNNAFLVSVATYMDFVPAFLKLLEMKGGDLQSFYEECRRLAALPKAERHAKLNSLLTPKPRY